MQPFSPSAGALHHMAERTGIRKVMSEAFPERIEIVRITKRKNTLLLPGPGVLMPIEGAVILRGWCTTPRTREEAVFRGLER